MLSALLASLITTASIAFPTACPTGDANQTSTGTSIATVSSACDYGGPVAEGNAEAQAQMNSLEVGASATDIGYYGLEIVSEAQYSGMAPVGPDVFTFHIGGIMYSDGSWPQLTFTITTDGGSDSTYVKVEGGHFNYVDDTWSSMPIQTEGPYMADLRLTVSGENNGTGGGEIGATLIGIKDPVSQVPEPSTVALILVPLLVIMLICRPLVGRSS